MKSKFPILIAFEGIDGCGKSTQIHMLKEYLIAKGYQVCVKKWFSNKAVKDVLSKFSNSSYANDMLGAIMIATEFVISYDEITNDYADSYDFIIFDRYVYTAYARDGVRGTPDNLLRILYSNAMRPDITFYLSLDPEKAYLRKNNANARIGYFESGLDLQQENIAEGLKLFASNMISKDEIKKSYIDFQQKIIFKYCMMKEYNDFVKIDANQSIKEIFSTILMEADNIIHKRMDY